ncbi:hypothetical protein CQW23_32587 [Capsicum baccatum]|uniref:NB-ARC domain-containing protein n=1 Tax=Capsicum baccatum TaxID=33114 RepID=A0A2G2V495_CAPBA|nr:hypothetical protein CQW23_32587 [Capsicum baccatum]
MFSRSINVIGGYNHYPTRRIIPSAKAFPATLKKLKLKETYVSWSYLDIIAKLPNLEVLKLMSNACDGEEWHPNVRGFTRLKLFLIEDNRLEYWKSTDDNFPVLERLVLKRCRYLKEIPIEFAEIHTLQLIELRVCLPLGNLQHEFKKNRKTSETTPWMFVSPILMGLMSLVESCNLFRRGGFANEELPSEFETTAMQIEDKCHASPPNIVVVAGIVKSKRTIKDWKNVVKDVKSPVSNYLDEQCSRVLGLSYNHSTSDLKACLLYFGILRSFQVIIAKANVNTIDMTHATVASLLRTIESLLTSNSPMQSLSCDHREDFSALHKTFHAKDFSALYEKISSLELVVKNFEKNNVSGEMTDLELQIKEVANIVEQTIQLRETEVVLANDENLSEKAHERLSGSLQQAATDIDRIWKESTKIQDKGKHASKESTVQDFSSSTNNILNVNNNMVGRDDQKERLLEDLTASYSGEPKVIPIVGMGGIGKTTLAKEVYNNESGLRHFDVHAWATVSQQHNREEILLGLLRSTIKMDGTVKTKGEAELADMLQKSLKIKRYLIVLDDIWSCEVWDGVRRCFPTEDNAGS